MKKIIKPNISNVLTIYADEYPNNTWENFRNSGWQDIQSCGIIDIVERIKPIIKSPYKDIQDQIFKIQGGLCAYCEQDFSSKYGDDDYINKMIEHFHPKRDSTSEKNWALDWNNLLGCCSGGSDSNRAEFPRPENLSCDKYKEYTLEGKNNIEGTIINPIEVPAFPCLFKLEKSTGELLPDSNSCNYVQFTQNSFPTTNELVKSTINNLNLNCPRLLRKRLSHIDNYQQLIKKAREENNENIFQQLCERFLQKSNDKYHCFFTTYRILLSENAENYLKQNNFSG